MSRARKFIKGNIFVIVIIAAYWALPTISPSLGVLGGGNSVYYIKEMLIIMPVIFVLTALVDTWVSKETITKFLGREAKTKGVMFSFILGSISAGPIYAAFSICTKTYPQMFQMDSKKAILKQNVYLDMALLKSDIKACPVMAIELN